MWLSPESAKVITEDSFAEDHTINGTAAPAKLEESSESARDDMVSVT